jgi:hypothetical protein
LSSFRAHVLGKPWYQPLYCCLSRLGRHVARAYACPSGCQD